MPGRWSSEPTRAACLALFLALYPLSGSALDIVPSITVGEIYSSNVNLTSDSNPPPAGQSKDDWVTRIAPHVAVGYQGSRLDLDIDYTLEALFYAKESGRNEAYNQLSAAGLLDLIGEDLQFRADASISQMNISPELAVTNSNINTTGNRTDALIWNVGPEWRHRVFGNSVIDGHLTTGRVDYNEPSNQDAGAAPIQDVTTTSGRMSLHTADDTLSAISYEATYEYDNLEYNVSGDSVVASAWLQMGYQINESFQVFGLAGADSDFAKIDDPALTEPRWELGVASTFTADTLRASFGHRFFGTTYNLSWEHETDIATYGVSYSETPTTSDLNSVRQIPTVPPGTEPGTPPPDSGLDRPGNPTRYIRKRADADISWNLYRSRVTANAFWEDRQDQTVQTPDSAEPVTPLNNETSYGANLDVRWELGSRTDTTFGAGWTHREFNDLTTCQTTGDCSDITTDGDDLYTLRAALDHELGLRTSLQLETGYQSRQGTSGGQSDYDEFWASVQVIRTFGSAAAAAAAGP